MAVLSCTTSLSTNAVRPRSSNRQRRLHSPPLMPCSCHLPTAESKNWRTVISTALAAAVVSFGGVGTLPSLAELNKFEAEMRGEFGIGSAAQFGSADLKKVVHVNENFSTGSGGYKKIKEGCNLERRSHVKRDRHFFDASCSHILSSEIYSTPGRANFTSADMRESDFSGSTFNGAYLEKAVAYKANFSGADLSDTLMDRMVLNEANFTNAILVRSVLTRSDLGGAIIEGADFSDAVLDFPQKLALCKYANGTNPITGVSTRKSLGCGNSRRSAYGSPSSPLMSSPPPKLLDRDGFCDASTGLCKAN